MKYVMGLLLLAACSSSSQKLSDKAKNIEVVPTKPQGCSVVGKIVGLNEAGSKDLALNHALNQAADIGATSLFVDQEVPNGKVMKVFATAFLCE